MHHVEHSIESMVPGKRSYTKVNVNRCRNPVHRRAERVNLLSPNKEKDAMPRNASIPEVDRSDKCLETSGKLTLAMKA